MDVSTWVIHALTSPEDDGDPHIVKVTCRLDAPDVVDLDRVAKRLNMSRTAAATGLLTAAIYQASSAVNFYDENPEYLDDAERQMHEERYERERQEGPHIQIADLERFATPTPTSESDELFRVQKADKPEGVAH